jgi:hypothetical protein
MSPCARKKHRFCAPDQFLIAFADGLLVERSSFVVSLTEQSPKSDVASVDGGLKRPTMSGRGAFSSLKAR